MRTLQIVGLAVGLLVASVIVVAGMALFLIPEGTFDGARDAIDGIEEEGDAADGEGGDDAAETQTDG